jgi:hypothetical protein
LIDILPKNDYSNEPEQRPCTAVSTSLSKTSVHFIKQRQNTSLKLNSDRATRDINLQDTNNIDDLNKTIRETLLIRSISLGISSSKNLNKTK